MMLLTLGGGGRFLSYLVPPGASGSVKQRQIYCLRAHIYSRMYGKGCFSLSNSASPSKSIWWAFRLSVMCLVASNLSLSFNASTLHTCLSMTQERICLRERRYSLVTRCACVRLSNPNDAILLGALQLE